MRVAPKNTKMNTRFWTWPIAIYLFLGGLGGGTIFMAGIFFFMGLPNVNAMVEFYGVLAPEAVLYSTGAPLGFAIFLGIVCLALGCLLLIFELGQPKLFVRAFITKTAIIKWGAVLLTIAMIAALIWWVIFYWPHEWNLFWYEWTGIGVGAAAVAMVASMGLMVYTGVLLSSMKARPFWNTPAVPILFTVSALSTGCALLSLWLGGSPLEFWMFAPYREGFEIVAVIGFSPMEYVYEMLHLIDTILVVAEIIILLLFVVMQYSSNELGAKKVAARWIKGETKVVFWGGMIVLGLLVPLGCYLAGGAVIAGIVAPVLALCGGLLLRFLFVYNNDRRGIPGEVKYFDRLPDKGDPILHPYWENNGGKAYVTKGAMR